MKLLFYTSCGMIIGNAYTIFVCKSPIKLIWTFGLLTSVINHSILSETSYAKVFFRTLDRNTMRAGFIIYHLYQVKYLYILQSSAFCYIISKLTKKIHFHVLSHLLIVIFHNKMLPTLSIKL